MNIINCEEMETLNLENGESMRQLSLTNPTLSISRRQLLLSQVLSPNSSPFIALNQVSKR